MRHPQAGQMLQYAIDAQKTDKPWELWEFRDTYPSNSPWKDLKQECMWLKVLEYRRKIVTTYAYTNVYKDGSCGANLKEKIGTVLGSSITGVIITEFRNKVFVNQRYEPQTSKP